MQRLFLKYTEERGLRALKVIVRLNCINNDTERSPTIRSILLLIFAPFSVLLSFPFLSFRVCSPNFCAHQPLINQRAHNDDEGEMPHSWSRVRACWPRAW